MKPTLFEHIDAGAQFSTCRNYRYVLWRIWDKEKPCVMFIGLNPSKANEGDNDNTIKRVMKIAKNLGFGGIYMVNCFAYVSTDPKQLKDYGDDDQNDLAIRVAADLCKEIIFAWGNFPEAKERGEQLAKRYPKGKALEINKNGSPKHPLYVKGDRIPVPYNLPS